MNKTKSYTKSKFRSSALIAALVLACASCSEQNYPSEVASGVARLTVNNLARLTAAISTIPSKGNRAECKFGDFAAVAGKTTIQDESHGKATATIAFHECEYDFGMEGVSLKVMGDKETVYYGKVKLSGTRSLSGLLTHNESFPIVPSGPGGVQLHFTKVEFDNFNVKSPDLKENLTMISGELAFDAQVHLAKDKVSTFCEVPLPNLTLKNIKYGKSIVRLPGPRGEFTCEVNDSHFDAQVGVHGDTVNRLSGTMKVWDSVVQVPMGSNKLNPEFELKHYEESVSKIENLAKPLESQCRFEPELATGVARLTIAELGALMKDIVAANRESIDKRSSCLLGSIETKPNEVNAIDETNAVAIWKFSNCVYEYGNGTIRLSGQRVVRGEPTGSDKIPVIPTNNEVLFDFSTVAFEKVRFENKSENELIHELGSLAFSVTVHLESKRIGNQEIPTKFLPNLTFKSVKYLGANHLTLVRKTGKYQGAFKVVVDDSNFSAQAGSFEGVENKVEGGIKVLGDWLPLAKGTDLDPKYDPKAGSDFGAPSMGKDTTELYISEVAAGAARLSVANLVKMLAAVSNKEVPHKRHECRFYEVRALAGLTKTEEHGNGRGKAVYAFRDCEFDLSGVELQLPGKKEKSKFFGKVKLTGTRSVSGLLTQGTETPVIPSGAGGIDFDITDVHFENFRVEDQDKTMTMRSGGASFKANIQLAQNEKTKVCDVPLSNVSVKNVRYTPKTILVVPGKKDGIVAEVDASDFSAQVGARGSIRNQLDGTMTLWGKSVKVPSSGSLLIPEDATIYSEQTPQVCHYEPELAVGLSRLTIGALGSLMKEIVAENRPSIDNRAECLLRSWDNAEQPQTAERYGDVTWTFSGCVYEVGGGRVSLSGKRTVYGELIGLRDFPVIPTKNDIHYAFSSVEFENVNFSNSLLTHESGALAFDVDIHLENEWLGTREIPSKPLSNLTFTNVRYLGNNDLKIGDAKVKIEDVELSAQNGTFAGNTDTLHGKIKMLGEWRELRPEDQTLYGDGKAKAQDYKSDASIVSEILKKTDDFATSIARGSVDYLALLLLGLTTETDRAECRMRDFAVVDGKTRVHNFGNGYGRIEWDFEDCEFDFGPIGTSVAKDITLFGKVRVSGTRFVTGILTSNKDRAVVPSGPGGFDIDLKRVNFDNYRVQQGEVSEMVIVKGDAAYKANILFGKSRKTDVCEVILPNIALSDIRFASATLFRFTDGPRDLEVEVDASDFDAQMGVRGSVKDRIDGTMSIFGKTVRVPKEGAELHPGFDEASYWKKVLSSHEDLVFPLEESCSSEPVLAARLSQLTMANLATIMKEVVATNKSAIDKRPECELGSFDSAGATTQWVDANEADVTWTFKDCTYELGQSAVTLSGQRTVRGQAIAHAKLAVLPTTGDVHFKFSDVKLHNFPSVSTPDHFLKHESGTLSFDVTVHLEKEKLGKQEIFSKPLSNLTFENVKYNGDNKVVLSSKKGNFAGDYHFAINDSDLRAQTGTFNGTKDKLEGQISLFGNWLQIKPEYQDLEREPVQDVTALPQGSASVVSKILENHAEISLGVSRLSVFSFGHLLSAIYHLPPHARAECNFQDENKKHIEKKDLGRAQAIWSFDDCEYDFGTAGVALDGNVIVKGKVRVSGQRSLFGLPLQTRSYPVVPTGPGGIEYLLSDVRFDNFSVTQAGSNKAFKVVKGRASYAAHIQLGKGKSSRQCNVPLPNITVKDIRYAQGTIVSMPEAIGALEIEVDDSSFTAQVGVKGTVTNKIEGAITLWGKPLALQHDLEPGFSASAYEAALADIKDLELPLKEVCEVESELIPVIIRLTSANLIELAKRIIDNDKGQEGRPECVLGRFDRPYSALEWLDKTTAIAMWKFSTCTYKLDEGSVTVTGHWGVTGEPTGIVQFPIMPSKPLVNFHFEEVRFDNFAFKAEPEKARLVQESGSLAFDLIVHFENEMLGSRLVPSLPLDNLTLKDVRYNKDSAVVLTLPASDSYRLVIDGSDFNTQVGRFEDKVNKIEGKLQVFGVWHEVIESQQYLLSEYKETPSQKISNKGVVAKIHDEGEMLAPGIAQLSVNSLARLLEVLQKTPSVDGRRECAFSEADFVIGHTTIEERRDQYGSMTIAFKDCEYDLGSDGKVKVSGRRSINGLLTGNDKKPVVPTGEDPIEIELSSVAFDHLRVRSPLAGKEMTLVKGSAAYKAVVQLGRSYQDGPCDKALSNVTLKNIRFAPDTVARIEQNGGHVDVEIHASDLFAQNEIKGDVQNRVKGTLNLWGKEHAVDADLDEDAKSFTKHEVCSLEPRIAGSVAGVLTNDILGITASIVEGNKESIDKRPECRLKSFDSAPDSIVKADSKRGVATWMFANCVYAFPQGTVEISGTRSALGRFTKSTKFPFFPEKDLRLMFSKVVFNDYVSEINKNNGTVTSTHNGALAFDVEANIEDGAVKPSFKNIRLLGANQLRVLWPSGIFAGESSATVEDSVFDIRIDDVATVTGRVKMYGKWSEIHEVAQRVAVGAGETNLKTVQAKVTPVGNPPVSYVSDIRNLFADILDPAHGPPNGNEELLREALVQHADTVFWLIHRPELLEQAGIPQELESFIKPIATRAVSVPQEDLKELFWALDDDELTRYVADIDEAVGGVNIKGFEGLSKIEIPKELGTNFSDFLRNVLKNYFPSLKSVDKKRIMASVLRRTTPESDEIQTMLAIVYASGPFFQKLIQLLSDKLPKGEMRKALSKVKRNLPSIDPYDREQYVKELAGLGVRIELLRSIGAASVGEAYLAQQLFDEESRNRQIVVKFMRPGIESIAYREHAFLEAEASAISISMKLSYEAIAEQIFEELDFEHELLNLRRGVEVYTIPEFPSLSVVRPIDDFPSGKRWMAMDFVNGKTLDEIRGTIREGDVSPLRRAKLELMSKAVMLNILTTAFIRMALFPEKNAYFHGDLHEGNVLMNIDYENAEQWFKDRNINMDKMTRQHIEDMVKSGESPVKMILVDFGNAHDMDMKDRIALFNLFISAADISASPEAFLAAFQELSPPDQRDVSIFKENIRPFFANIEEKFCARIAKSIDVLQQNNVFIPGSVLAFYRSVDLLANAYRRLREDAKAHNFNFDKLTLEEAMTAEIVNELVFNRVLDLKRMGSAIYGKALVDSNGPNIVFIDILSKENVAAIQPNLPAHAIDRFVGINLEKPVKAVKELGSDVWNGRFDKIKNDFMDGVDRAKNWLSGWWYGPPKSELTY